MTEGTTFVVMSMPEIWSVIAPTILLSTNINNSNLELVALPSGHLNLRIEDSNKKIINYYTQRIIIDEQKYQLKKRDILLGITWKLPEISIYINTRRLLNIDESKGDNFIINFPDLKSDKLPSYAHPDALQACQNWVSWRGSEFLSTKIIGNNKSRKKTIYEQINELQKAKSLLNDFSNGIKNGNYKLLGTLAVELRAMLYWNGRKTYNPLLLRLAGKFAIPLPIYLIQINSNPPALSPLVHLCIKEASIYKEYKTQSLADIQDWLNKDVLVTQNERLKTKDIILNASTKLGGAHYDEDIPENLDFLLGIKSDHFNQLESFLLTTASIVADLSQYVISNITASINK